MRSCVAFISVSLLAINASLVSAETIVAPSLEWLADYSAASGTYRVRAVNRLSQGYKIELQQEAKLRGNPPSRFTASYYAWRKSIRSGPSAGSPTRRALVDQGDKFLICFERRSKDSLQARQLINLTYPQRNGPAFTAITSRGKLLTDGPSILRSFQQRLRQRPAGEPATLSLNSPGRRMELEVGNAAFRALYSGSACYLLVPDDLAPSAEK